MTNLFPQAKMYANTMLAMIENELVLTKLVDSEGTNKRYSDKETNGVTYVKKPPEFNLRSGLVAAPQDIIIGETPVAIDKYRGVDTAITDLDTALNVNELTKNSVMKSVASTIAQGIDYDVGQELLKFNNFVGTAGSVVASPAVFFNAPQRLDELGVPDVDRCAVVSAADGYAMAGHLLSNAAQNDSGIAEKALKAAKITVMGNTQPYMSNNVPRLTLGTRTNGAVNGAGQISTYAATAATGTQSLIIDGVGAAGTIKAGEVFTIAGCYEINPRSKQPYPYLKQFTVTTDATASGGGAATITISPPIITTGAYQNVSAAPADNAVITWYGAAGSTLVCNAAFYKPAIKLVSAKLIKPFTGISEEAVNPKTGLAVRLWMTSDSTTGEHCYRWDVLYGVKNIDIRYGTRFNG